MYDLTIIMIYIGYKDVKLKEDKMDHTEIINTLYEKLKTQNCKGRVVSIEHVLALKDNIEKPHLNGLLDEALYERELNHFDFDASTHFPEAKSLIVVAVPQPHVRVTFHPDGKPFTCLIPSNYSHKTDDFAQDIVESYLNSEDFRVSQVRLPFKSLAVQSGLAEYGRNNISYVKGMGSFFRLVAFASDLPCFEDNWREFKIMERCEACTVCLKMCPAGAIRSERFLLHVERCITYYSEGREEFPEWLDPSWLRCLVGCLICQKVCPVDREFVHYIEEGGTFSSVETNLILEDISADQLPEKTVEKLESLGILEYVGLLGRNLKILMENSKVNHPFKTNTSMKNRANKNLR